MKLLISGSQIFAMGPVLDDGNCFMAQGVCFPRAALNAGQVVEVAELPVDFSVTNYDWISGALQRKATDLTAAKATKRAQINDWRRLANESVFSFRGKDISSDPLSRSDIAGVSEFVALNAALPPDWPGGWKCADNSILPIPDVATFKAFQKAMVVQGTQNFVRAQTLKAAVDAALTQADLEAITW